MYKTIMQYNVFRFTIINLAITQKSIVKFLITEMKKQEF